MVSPAIGVLDPRALEREIARCFNVHLAVAGEDGHHTRDEAFGEGDAGSSDSSHG